MRFVDPGHAETAVHEERTESGESGGGDNGNDTAQALIRSIVPGPVVAVDTFTDEPDAELYPEEQEHVARAVDVRRREFTTARWCARQALGRLGFAPGPIGVGQRGEPQWPEGVVGSITHCLGYRGAVAARADRVVTVGIDAEPNETLPEGVLATISLPAERTWIDRLLAARPDVHWDRLLFSAKESVYKSWYPLMHAWLDFEEALITVDPDQGTFNARLLIPGPQVHGSSLTGFDGRWLVSNGLVLTAIVLPSP